MIKIPFLTVERSDDFHRLICKKGSGNPAFYILGAKNRKREEIKEIESF
jgi:hypothetical protein